MVELTFADEWACWTETHAVRGGLPHAIKMALGAVRPSADATDSAAPTDRALILHQFGHVLGLGHEHLGPRESGGVAWKEEDVLGHRSFQGFESDFALKEQLSTYVNGSVSNYGVPDLASVML